MTYCTKKIGLVQINSSFSGASYLPYSVGLLQAYANRFAKNASRFTFLEPIYCRESTDAICQKLSTADIVFFSTYVWNLELSVAVAKQLKKQKENCIVIMGGPQIPDQAENFLEHYPFIDLVVHGEGEEIFKLILENQESPDRIRDWSQLPSVSYLTAKGKFQSNPKKDRIKNLDEIPSPYLDGVFQNLIKNHPETKWIGTWETNRGCPFSCTYCDWGSAVQSRVYKFNLDRVFKEAEWFGKNKIEFIFCADANFGMLQRDLDIVNKVSEVKKLTGYPHALSVQNTKNATEKAYAVQSALAQAGLNKGVTISLQTLSDDALENVKRKNISSESYQELQRRFTRDGVETYSDMILALPGETRESFMESISDIVENGQHNRIQFGNLSILPNAEMGSSEYQVKYKLKIVECPVVNIHGSMDSSENAVIEKQRLVIGTYSMSTEDWIKVRSFSWICSLFYFNKILQIPIMLLNKHSKLRFHEIVLALIDGKLNDFPTLKEIKAFFHDTAKGIVEGGPEYVASKKWLGIWWPADELLLINLCTEGKLEAFYSEVEDVFLNLIKKHNIDFDIQIMKDSLEINKKLIKQPFQNSDLTIQTQYNIWDAYLSAREEKNIPLLRSPSAFKINRSDQTWDDWQIWCKEVIWWGNKKGAYLYKNQKIEPQYAGHF